MIVGRDVLAVNRFCRSSSLSPSLFGTNRVTTWPSRDRGAMMIGDFDCNHSSDLPISLSSSPQRATRQRDRQVTRMVAKVRHYMFTASAFCCSLAFLNSL